MRQYASDDVTALFTCSNSASSSRGMRNLALDHHKSKVDKRLCDTTHIQR